MHAKPSGAVRVWQAGKSPFSRGSKEQTVEAILGLEAPMPYTLSPEAKDFVRGALVGLHAPLTLASLAHERLPSFSVPSARIRTTEQTSST